jgi:voltage-gated potassium channel
MKAPDSAMLDRRPWLERAIGTVPGMRWLVSGIVAVSLVCALIMRLIDSEEFPTFGLALWWSIQTVTTVGYGDVTPKTVEGRFVAGVLMVAAIALISLLTASIAAAFVNRLQRRRAELHQDPVLSALERIEQRLEQLEQRLDSS